jgi:AcrR family transcriptional regulator
MLQIVLERSYAAVTVRELAQAAGVSSRAFYENYSGKEECFLRTHEAIVRRIARRVAAAQAGESDWRRRLRRTIDAYLGELQREPRAARFLLVDAYVTGSMALKQVRWAEQTLETSIVDCFELRASRPTLSPQITRGIAVGVMCAARLRLDKSRKPAFRRDTEKLTNWVSAVFGASNANEEPITQSASQWPGLAQPLDQSIDEWPRWVASDERGLIVSALAKLAAVEGYEKLTVQKIRTSAGASSKKFNAHFSGVADCFQKTVDAYTRSIADNRSSSHRGTHMIDQRPGDSVAFLCERVAQDPALAALGFVDVFCPGYQATRSLEQFIEQISDLLAYEHSGHSASDVTFDISAGAIWGAIREEIICGRRRQLPEVVPMLRDLIPISAEAKKDVYGARSETGTSLAFKT